MKTRVPWLPQGLFVIASLSASGPCLWQVLVSAPSSSYSSPLCYCVSRLLRAESLAPQHRRLVCFELHKKPCTAHKRGLALCLGRETDLKAVCCGFALNLKRRRNWSTYTLIDGAYWR